MPLREFRGFKRRGGGLKRDVFAGLERVESTPMEKRVQSGGREGVKLRSYAEAHKQTETC